MKQHNLRGLDAVNLFDLKSLPDQKSVKAARATSVYDLMDQYNSFVLNNLGLWGDGASDYLQSCKPDLRDSITTYVRGAIKNLEHTMMQFQPHRQTWRAYGKLEEFLKQQEQSLYEEKSRLGVGDEVPIHKLMAREYNDIDEDNPTFREVLFQLGFIEGTTRRCLDLFRNLARTIKGLEVVS